VHPGDLAGGFSDLEMTWLFYCAGVITAPTYRSCMIFNLFCGRPYVLVSSFFSVVKHEHVETYWWFLHL